MISPPVAKERVGHRWDGGLPPQFGGGGGGGANGGNGLPDFTGRLRRARLGLAVGLAPVFMLFFSFSSVYVIRQGWLFPSTNELNPIAVEPPLLPLPWLLFVVNTLVLIVSSVTMERARREAIRQAALAPIQTIPGVSLGEEKPAPWLEITMALGLLFLAGQTLAWHELRTRGFYLATTSSSSFTYLLTGMHAVHLAGGIAVLLYALLAAKRRSLEVQRITVDVVAWYWHFLAVLWLYILGLFLLMG